MATMYGDIGTGIADVIQARKAQKEQGFYNSLLSYGMQAGGEFEIVNDTPVFTPGGDMPTKSAMWNQLLQAKGGRLSAADVQQFESAWKQANQMKTSKQLQELNKLSLKGYSPKKIRDSIEDSPDLYNNLLDLVGDLEASGDENAFAQAQVVKGMLPTMDTGGLIGGMYEDPGLGSSLAIPATILGGVGLHSYLSAPDTAGVEAKNRAKIDKKDITSQRRVINKDMKKISLKPDSNAINNATRKINLNKIALDDELKKNVAQRNDSKIKRLKAEKITLNSELDKAKKTPIPENQKKYDALKKQHSDLGKDLKATNKIIADKPLSKYGQMSKAYDKLGKGAKFGVQGAAYAGLGSLRSLGKYLGGETGESIGRTAGNLGMLGMALRGGYAAPLLAYQPIKDLYAQYQGK